MEKIKAFIVRHPWGAVAIAAGVGMLIRPGVDRVTGGAVTRTAGQVAKLPVIGPTLAKAVA